MKPFLLISTRENDLIADEEYTSVLRYSGLQPEQLSRIRLEQASLPELALDEFSGIIIGGSPFNSSDPEELKSETQLRVERELAALLDRIVAEDFPFLGACYGVGTLGIHQGGIVDRTFGEPVGAVTIDLTEDGRHDPLLADLPTSFDALVGHKEALSQAPPHATILATSTSCPVQMFRVKSNVYATQFHPELDGESVVHRLRVYRNEGYFAPEELDALIAKLSHAGVPHAGKVLRAFVRRYAQPA